MKNGDLTESFIFDTNIYDIILEKEISPTLIKSKGDLYITNVQISQIKNIPNEDKRNKILKIVEDLNQVQVCLESGIWLDDLYWDDNQIWIDKMGDTFLALIGNAKNDHKWTDPLIGEVAKKHSLTLITNDKKFKNKAEKIGIKTLSFDVFLNQ